jgi:hypothetical protein
MTGLGRGASGRPTTQGPAFAERGAITDLERHTFARFAHLDPERVGLVERDWVVFRV